MKSNRQLEKSYDLVGKKILQRNNLNLIDLKNSLNLFTKKSIKKKKPKTIYLEVYGLLSGLPFSRKTLFSIEKIKKELKKILKNKLCYWVKPKNLAVEYCVFKWPKNKWQFKWEKDIISFLENSNYKSFCLLIKGIQIHEDGCIIAKGYEKGKIQNIRSEIISKLKFIPKKQSNWAHIPIGRILEPISGSQFSQLKKMVSKLSKIKISSEKIDRLNFVHETRWYMEEKKIILKKKLFKYKNIN